MRCTVARFDFVKKPYEAGELISTMETALRQCKLEIQNLVMEEKLKESEELHRFIVNNSPDLVYMLDRNGCFTFLNDRIESLLGYRKNELIGRHYSELVDDDHLEMPATSSTSAAPAIVPRPMWRCVSKAACRVADRDCFTPSRCGWN